MDIYRELKIHYVPDFGCLPIDVKELQTDFIENDPVAHMLRKMYIYK